MGILWYRCQGCGLIGEVLIRWIVSLTGKNGSQVLTAHVNSSLYKAWGYYIPTQTLAMGVDCINRPRAACSSNHPHGFTYTFLGWMRPHRFTLSRACIKKWGPKYAQGGNDCDEYPFAGTFQGASRAKGRWWYSVMVLPLSQNRRAGALLGNWLTDNHILAGDKYWVEVTK
jgi:hypothetical protein